MEISVNEDETLLQLDSCKRPHVHLHGHDSNIHQKCLKFFHLKLNILIFQDDNNKVTFLMKFLIEKYQNYYIVMQKKYPL